MGSLVQYLSSYSKKMEEVVKVLVASNSQIKLDAVREAFEGPFRAQVDGRGSKSLVSEQPVGMDETMKGAHNRLSQILQIPGYDYYVSIENGLEPLWGAWFDFAFVLIQDSKGVARVAKSAGVVFPEDCVEEARKRGFETTTAGMIVAERYGGNETDPHHTLTGVRRKKLLAQAVGLAFGNLIQDSIRSW